jgi:hypothetical protein
MAEQKKPQHPSGRPHRRDKYVKLGLQRPPRDEPLTPRLQKRGLADAIGFRVTPDDYDED